MGKKSQLFFWLLALFALDLSRAQSNTCVNMWDAVSPNAQTKICEVQTDTVDPCSFPFTFKNIQYYTCIVTNSVDFSPQCMTASNVWANCSVPMDAVVNQVTTRKGGPYYINGVSLNGGTMLWISGYRFAPNLFSINPTSLTSNRVFLVNTFASYECQIHPDKTTTTQITCYAPAMMLAGTYFVKVMVNGFFVPMYQYISLNTASIQVSDSNTPKIFNITPIAQPSGSFVTLNGDFKTICYGRDDSSSDPKINCGDDSQAIIQRVYVGGQNCQLKNTLTNQFYGIFSNTSLYCQLNKPEVNYFNATILISNEYGRSLAAPTMFYVSADDNLYNYQTYAVINSISPSIGSIAGGNVTINGLFFYDDINVPARIEVGGQPCFLIDFDMSNLPNTTFVCQNSPQSSVTASASEFYGNRGLNLITDSIYTPMSSLATVQPSTNAQYNITDQAAYYGVANQTVDLTVWLIGFLSPKTTSLYELNLVTNNSALLYLSTDSSSVNKVLIASTDMISSAGTFPVQLEANKNYYFEARASVHSDVMQLAVNAKMLQTSLTETVSAYVKNEKQQIEISSTIVPESYVKLKKISFDGLSIATGMSEIQNIEIIPIGADQPFVLRYDGVTTTYIDQNAMAIDVQNALSDLPNLGTDLVTVTQSLNSANNNVYSIKFSADLGDVPLLEEVSGKVNSTIVETTKGVPTAKSVQLNIQNNISTGLFKLTDKPSNIQNIVTQAFGIRCPQSILTGSDVFLSNDFESCSWTNDPLDQTVFCGKCSKINSEGLTYAVNSPLIYKYICFAYKLTVAITLLNYYIKNPVSGSLDYFTSNVQTIADNKWHYLCTDMSNSFSSSKDYKNRPLSSIYLFQAWISPAVANFYIDSLTIRKTLPLGYNDDLLSTSRRLYPAIQIVYNTFNVKSAGSSSLTFSYRPANCLYNLTAVTLTQSIPNVKVTVTSLASPPVTGTFQLNWYGQNLDISPQITDVDLMNTLQSLENFGLVNIIRTKDCAGYRWQINWLTGGAIPLLNITTIRLNGLDPALNLTEIQKGGALFQPIRGDMLKTYHNKPQVTVSINNLNSKCLNSCDFEWSSSATPIVNSIDTTQLNSIKISGSGFDSNPKNTQVNIGSVPCSIVSLSSTQIICSAGQNSIGTYQFTVSVFGKGNALMNVNPSVSFQLTTTTVNPAMSGTGGGVTVNITGTGFNSNCTVTVDGFNCPAMSISYTLITCVIPANPTKSNKHVDIVVNEGQIKSTMPQAFFYNADATPIVNSIEPNVLSVIGNQTLNISGVNLPSCNSVSCQATILIGSSKVLNVISSTSTNLIVQSPSLQPGIYDLVIPTLDLGYTLSNIKLEYVLYVSSVSPSVVSIRGGAVATVYGDGFSTNCTQNQVSFANQTCNIVDCSKNWIKCQTSSATISYYVNNSASDPYYGLGYAWSQSYLRINKGDSVNWSWQPPIGITGVSFKVEQVQDASSIFPIGFTSGEATPTGSFSFQFNMAGTYYYWSGYVESSQQIVLRGVVVVLDSFDKELEVFVSLNGFQAQKCAFPFVYNSVSYDTCTNQIFNYSWCSPTQVFLGQSLHCDPIEQAPVETCEGTSLDFSFYNLTTPSSAYNILFTAGKNQLSTISNVNSSNVFNSIITINGFGFSATSCENQVYIDDVLCPLISSSTSQLECKLSYNSGLQPNIAYQVKVLVKNFGYTLQNGLFILNFQPIVTSFAPQIGSLAGGTQITINGIGFIKSSCLVQIGPTTYYHDGINTNISYNSIVLNTNSDVSNNAYEVKVISNDVAAVCETMCNFTYSSNYTPVITEVSPGNASSASLITIKGTNFGTSMSSINAKVGSQNCDPVSLSQMDSNGTQIFSCQLNGLNLGDQPIQLNIQGLGNSQNPDNLYVTGLPSVDSIEPSSGSIYGGTLLTIQGNGFDKTTKVNIGSSSCSIKSVKINRLTCVTGSNNGASGSLGVQIKTGNTTYSSILNFNYDSTVTPLISSIMPVHGFGDMISITGSGFGTNSSNLNVLVGSQSCEIDSTSISDSQISCSLRPYSAGVYPVLVNLNNQGYSNSDKTYTFDLTVSHFSANQGSLGGRLSLVITGKGFSANTTVKICGNICSILNNSVDLVTCSVPPATNKIADSVCTVVISQGGQTASGTFSYLLSLTPKLTSVSPLRGGTGGGTLLTITGNNFPSNPSDVIVTIAGSKCVVSSLTSTQIQCRTNSYAYSSVKAPVNVFIQNAGLAYNDDSVQFQYIDLWSSIWTWGGLPPPGEGDIAVIGPNQYIYFDTTTPILTAIIIQSGSLIFDDNQDVNLNVGYIVITDGGTLQVGTRNKPFTHKATITMHGSVRSIELPIFGSKVIALRNGTIDMHGSPVGVTWTHLGMPALSGSSRIVLKEPVSNWPIGGQIVIATTGDKFSPGESEVRTIVAKSSDNTTLILDRPLEFTHLCEIRTIGNGSNIVKLDVRAEVGLLSRNVVYQGYNDQSWAPMLSAQACPSGFDPSEFAVQTCFLGKYGPELGTDQFGATIMLSGTMRDTNSPESVIGRFSNVELFHVGQAYRLGRYPIHFHMNGDMPSSYVVECAIHESFNRATNIHASNYLTIESNFIYNIMGGAFFLEDGVEIGNVFKNNLAIFVVTSSSGINEDLTPAAFWATNPNNTYVNNAVAGCSHFGFWYRLLDHPEGPSYTSQYCPNKIRFGTFFNNSVHSSGRFGLWIFPGYSPTAASSCWEQIPSVARFHNLTAWSNDKGAEFVDSNNIQFLNFTLWDHFTSGIETRTLTYNDLPNSFYNHTFYDETICTLIGDCVIVGNSTYAGSSILEWMALTTDDIYGATGIAIAWNRGELVKNVAFFNFPENYTQAIRPPTLIGMFDEGGWTTEFKGLSFYNVARKTLHRWDWDAIYKDLDGSLTGAPNSVVVAKDNITLHNPSCNDTGEYTNGIVCYNPKTWIRFSYNAYEPRASMLVNFTNENNQTASAPMQHVHLTHSAGFTIALEVNQSYSFVYDKAPRPTNISLNATFYGLLPNDYVILKFSLNEKPDQVSFKMNSPLSESYLPLSTDNNNGDWYWDNETYVLSFIIINKPAQLPFADYPILIDVFKCRYAGCIRPVNPSYNLPVKSRPADALYWSNPSTWSIIFRPGWAGQFGLPKENDSVLIPSGKYVVLDCAVPYLTNLQIEGILEFDNRTDHYLEVEFIFINGGQLIIGWEHSPILTNVQIKLTNKYDQYGFMLPSGLDMVGTKGIGVYGGLDLHGRPRNVSWTWLFHSVYAGNNTARLVDAVDWQVGEQIVFTTTTYVANQSDVMTIEYISSDRKTLVFNSTFEYDHLAYSEMLSSGVRYKIAAGVGLLTRNLKIISDETDSLQGFRMIVSTYSAFVNQVDIFYKGYARVSNTEFVGFGQKNLYSGDDSKYGILFSDLAAYNDSRPSYVRSSVFHDGFSCAIGIFGSASIPIENNVVYNTYNYGLNIQGNSNIIRKNLVTWIISEEYFGAIDVTEADSIVLEDNFVAGAQRLGYNFRGDVCPGKSVGSGYNHSIKGNTVYGALSGVVILPIAPVFASYNFYLANCVRISGFTVYKSAFWGIYYHGLGSLITDNNILIDNQVSLFTFIYRPDPLTHQIAYKSSYISNCLFVGQSPSFDCVNDLKTDGSFLTAPPMVSFGAGSSYNSKIGMIWSNFLGNKYDKPYKQWPGIHSYPSINGITNVNNVTFAHFDTNCYGSYDACIATNKANDDAQHPVNFRNIHLDYVNNKSKVFIHRPNIEKITPSCCFDMDCDGMKKNLLTDLDGSFLGKPGTVFSESEWQWGNQSRGIGDFRIPKVLLAAPNGSYIPPSQVYKYPGIVRDENLCTYWPEWQAHECHGLVHKMLIVESMDNDTETRRLSPIAILSDNGYLDLINGPQDNHWCGGYSCHKRISTFYLLIAANKSYDIYLTATPPNQLRFRILDADASFKVRLSVYYFTPIRIDAYVNNQFVPPTNADYSTGKMQINDPSKNLAAYMPSLSSPTGKNLFHSNERKMYFITDGSVATFDLNIAPVLYVRFGFPAITPAQFFNTQTLVGNLALLLGVDSSKIRKVQITRATSRKRRQNSANNLNYVDIYIYDDAASMLNDTNTVNALASSMTDLNAKISNMYMAGELQNQAEAILNVSLATMSVQHPNSNTTIQAVKKIGRIKVVTQADQCKAQTPCLVQPVIMVVDENGLLITNMGDPNNPWLLQAHINSSSNPNAQLLIETEVPVINGYANFTRLTISDTVDNLLISYQFKLPYGLNKSTFNPFSVSANPIQTARPDLACLQMEKYIVKNENALFNLTVLLVDAKSLLQIPNIAWNNYTWKAKIDLYTPKYYPGNGTLKTQYTTVTFDPASGYALFSNLAINKAGMYVITINVYSNNNEYNLNCYSNAIQIISAKATLPTYDSTSQPDYILKFNGSYSSIVPSQIQASVYNYMSKYGISIAGMSCYSGSVYVSFYSSSTNNVLILSLITSGITVSTSLTFNSITVGSTTYTCTNCTIVVQETSGSSSSSITSGSIAIGAIVGSVIGGILFLAGFVIAYKAINKLKELKETKTKIRPVSVVWNGEKKKSFNYYFNREPSRPPSYKENIFVCQNIENL